MPLLELVNLTKDFGRLRAVDGISLSIPEGEIRGLIGPNGSGKTTIFNLVSGFLRPSFGRVFWKGEEITKEPPHLVAKKGIARTFQITNVFKDETVLRNVTIASHLRYDSSLLGAFLGTHGSRRQEDAIHARAIDVLELMGLSGQKEKIAGELPSGIQKVLAIAIALVCDPKLIMLDEPMAGMNPVEKGILSEKIRSIRKSGATVLLVEHDMRTIMSLCDTITVIDFGKKIAEGPPSVVSNDQKTIEAYLGKQESLRVGS